MFDLVRNNKKFIQLVLAFIMLPFALWGVDSYVRNSASGSELATVGKSKITSVDLQGAMREQEERMRAQMGAQFNPAMLQTPEAKRTLLDNLINQRLLGTLARESQLGISDGDLAKFIASVPALQENGKFSPDRYAALVAGRGMSKEGFEARLRQDLAQQQLMQPIGESAISSSKLATGWAQSQLEQRVVEEFRVTPDQLSKQVTLEPDAVQKYYDENRKQFETPEQVRLEYVVLDQNELQAQIKIADSDVESRYKTQVDRYSQQESRRASHILIKLGKEASETEIKAAEAKMADIQAQVGKDVKVFADLARKHSDDPGSAQKGGDLDWFGRGMMVKPFEDAAFSLKEGQVSAPVRSDFGLHLIRVTGVKAAQAKPLAEVRNEIAAELRREQGARKFAEASESFSNMVYEQPDSLNPVAEKWKLPVRQTDWLAKGARLSPPFDNAKLGSAVFAEDATSRKQNTEAIDVGSGRLASARVLEHRPATVLELEVVRANIVALLTRKKASELAAADGEKKLAALQKGEAKDIKFGPSRNVLRAAPAGLVGTGVRSVFSADASKLPAFAGATAEDGSYVIYKIAAVIPAAKDDPRAAMLTQQYQRIVAETEFTAWLAALRQRVDIKINEKALNESAER